jgi:hypothetical protein
MDSQLSFLNSRVFVLGVLALAGACGDPGEADLPATHGLPPTVEILRPIDGEVFSIGRDIPLDCVAEAADGEAEVTYDWSAFPGRGPSIPLSNEPSTSTRDLGVGVHQIVCTASDGEFDNNALVTITVTNSAPIVTIVNPDPDGDLTFFSAETIAYVGSVFDGDFNADLDDLQWQVDSLSGGPTRHTGEGQRGTIPAGTLEPGEYQLMAYVRDDLSEVGSTWITFTVLPDPEDLPPSIVDGIVAATPVDGNDNPPVSYFVEQCLVDINGDGYHDGRDVCQHLTFNAIVTDDHDAPEDLTYTWTLREDGAVIDTFTTPASATELDLEPGHYELELVATDTAHQDSAPYFFPFIVDTLI